LPPKAILPARTAESKTFRARPKRKHKFDEAKTDEMERRTFNTLK
jgi:hypothetical protein